MVEDPFEPLRFDAQPIPELRWEETVDATEQRQPFVVRGGVASWEICTSLEARSSDREKIAYLTRLLGAHRVGVTELPPGATYMALTEKADPQHAIRRQVRFADFSVQLLASLDDAGAMKPYLEGGAVSALPELAQRIEDLPHAPPVHHRGVWIGPGGHVANLHYDRFFNHICMVEGHKRVVLLPYEAMPDMYHAPLDRTLGGVDTTRVRLLDVDLGKFPRFEHARARAMVAVLGRGDVLRIPPLWWHHVESQNFNVMVSQWCNDVPVEKVDDASYELAHAVWAFARISASAKEAYRTWLRRHVFRVDAGPEPSASALLQQIEEGAGRRIRRDVERSARAFDGLPDYWLRYYALKYDLFVFGRHGELFPGLPNELEAMARRLEGAEPAPVVRAAARVNRRLVKKRDWLEDRIKDAFASLRAR